MEETMAAAQNLEETPKDYKDPGLGTDHRVDDLLGRMTLAEKAGMLFQTMIVVGSGDLAERSSAFGVESAEHMINNQLLTHFNVVRTAAENARALADWHNRLQKLAASTRLGIPITLSTDPGITSPRTSVRRRGLAHSRSGPKPWAWRRSAPLNSCNASQTLRDRSTWRSVSGLPCTLRLILPPNPAGLGSTAVSARMLI
jgi:hypothetical protein